MNEVGQFLFDIFNASSEEELLLIQQRGEKIKEKYRLEPEEAVDELIYIMECLRVARTRKALRYWEERGTEVAKKLRITRR